MAMNTDTAVQLYMFRFWIELPGSAERERPESVKREG